MQRYKKNKKAEKFKKYISYLVICSLLSGASFAQEQGSSENTRKKTIPIVLGVSSALVITSLVLYCGIGGQRTIRKCNRQFRKLGRGFVETITFKGAWRGFIRSAQMDEIFNPIIKYRKLVREVGDKIGSKSAISLMDSVSDHSISLRKVEVDKIVKNLDRSNITVLTGNSTDAIKATLQDVVTTNKKISELKGQGYIPILVKPFALEADGGFKYVGGSARAVNELVDAAKADPKVVLVIENVDQMTGMGDSINGEAKMLQKAVQNIIDEDLRAIFTVQNRNYEKIKDTLTPKHTRVDLGMFNSPDVEVISDFFKFHRKKQHQVIGFADNANDTFYKLANNYYKADEQPFRFRNAATDIFDQFLESVRNQCSGICDGKIDELMEVLRQKKRALDIGDYDSKKLAGLDFRAQRLLDDMQKNGIEIHLNKALTEIKVSRNQVSKGLLNSKNLPEVVNGSLGDIIKFVDDKIKLIDLEGQDGVLEVARTNMINLFIKLKHGISDGPGGVWDLTGPTAAGKTSLTKQLNKVFFNSEDLIRINVGQVESIEKSMNEIVTKMHANKNAMLIFDEYDKNPKFLKGLMDMLDESVTCVNGKCIDLSQRPVGLISNFGASNQHAEMVKGFAKGQHTEFLNEMQNLAGKALFADGQKEATEALAEFNKLNKFWNDNVTDPVKELLVDAATLGRMQQFPFKELSPDARMKILSNNFDEMAAIFKKMEPQDFGSATIELSENAKKHLVYYSYTQEAGRSVRAYKRTILPNIRVKLAELMKLEENRNGKLSKVVIDIADDVDFENILQGLKVVVEY